MNKTLLDARVLTTVALLAISAALPSPLKGDTSELTQSEMRAAMRAGELMDSRALIAGVEGATGGSVIELRAFMSEADGFLFRVVVQMSSGKVSLLLVDGSSGEPIAADSLLAENVRTAARERTAARIRTFAAAQAGQDDDRPTASSSSSGGSSASSASAAATSASSGSGSDGARGNGNANGRSNASGNGNGNGGGNGNGNSNAGGNGRGNANGQAEELLSD